MKDYGSFILRNVPWHDLEKGSFKSPTFQIHATENVDLLVDPITNVFEMIQKLKEEQTRELDSIFKQQLNLRGLEVDEVFCHILEDRKKEQTVYRVSLSGHTEAIFIIECPFGFGNPVMVYSDLWPPCNVSYDEGNSLKEE